MLRPLPPTLLVTRCIAANAETEALLCYATTLHAGKLKWSSHSREFIVWMAKIQPIADLYRVPSQQLEHGERVHLLV
jgi:hypothetical protein